MQHVLNVMRVIDGKVIMIIEQNIKILQEASNRNDPICGGE